MPDPKTIETMKRFLEAMAKHEIPFAVGGGVAVNAHGVRRETVDVDAFVRDEDRAKIRKALLEAGFKIGRVRPPFHLIAVLPGTDDPDIRIDLMFPAGEPELSAIDKAVTLPVWGEDVPVFPVELLVFAKVIALVDSPERGAKDQADIEALHAIGAFEPGTVRFLIHEYEPELLTTYETLLKPKGGTRGWGSWPRRS